MDKPNNRSSHIKQVPNLGGIAFYIVLVVGLYFIGDQYDYASSLSVGLLVLFIVGLKDDLVVLSPVTKLIAQLLTFIVILDNPCFQVSNLHGFLSIHEVSLWISLPCSVLFMLTVINAINMIDGVDGLASTIGAVILGGLGLFFYALGLYYELSVCMIFMGGLLAFLRYNFSEKRKIFMGDTGSLILGYVIACMATRLIALPGEILMALPFPAENMPWAVLAVLFVPLFDVIRVFSIRIRRGKSPFKADRNHMHHLFVDKLKYSHIKTTLVTGVISVLIALFLVALCGIFNSWMVLLLFLALTILFFILIAKFNAFKSK